eukprot:1959688-Rhodomonas_salina.1
MRCSAVGGLLHVCRVQGAGCRVRHALIPSSAVRVGVDGCGAQRRTHLVVHAFLLAEAGVIVENMRKLAHRRRSPAPTPLFRKPKPDRTQLHAPQGGAREGRGDGHGNGNGKSSDASGREGGARLEEAGAAQPRGVSEGERGGVGEAGMLPGEVSGEGGSSSSSSSSSSSRGLYARDALVDDAQVEQLEQAAEEQVEQ